jgi:hypothetical protein
MIGKCLGFQRRIEGNKVVISQSNRGNQKSLWSRRQSLNISEIWYLELFLLSFCVRVAT